MLTTKDVARKIQRTPNRVLQLIWEGKLKATKHGNTYLITEEDLADLRLTKPTGRPSKYDKI